MNTSEMVRELCKAMNISLAELARRLQQSPQNFFKKIKRDSLTLEELFTIADILGVRYEQVFVRPNGEYISTANELQWVQPKGERNMTKVKGTFEKIMIELGETANAAVQDYIHEILNNVVEREKQFGIQHAVEALLDSNVDDDNIIRYLEKYWGMHDGEAIEAVRIIKTQVHPKNELKYYLKKQGYSDEEIRDFVITYRVGPELRTDHELWKLSPVKLVEKLKDIKEKRTNNREDK
ncbi:helix-turn-helix domain-containing protein [Trichococcus collinsii]|uniref:Cro/C1-type HTH DNA-binding domain-containing protein n=1 Tax=Trichococcus collinsii TaxID=157076 RepID=A0AB37ZXI9_9LACT|nr:helix-turn-helix transcriptional regulator [Trichococcus collinsii]CZQ82432.1 Hypothetical protein Tcol_212 [Trichococcus collinsii]SDZ87319.1 Cro/C1-type HTH DNA-binding domain-containing protein [Trichococcus collinsii]